MINQFKEAVAARPDCIEIMGHPGSAAFRDLVKGAVDQGIVVTVGNSPMSDLQAEFGANGMGYAGVDLYAGGKLTAAQRTETRIMPAPTLAAPSYTRFLTRPRPARKVSDR